MAIPAVDSTLWLLTGTEWFLIDETRGLLKKKYHEHERFTFEVTGKSNWQDIITENANVGLFCQKKYIEVLMATDKLGKSGSNFVEQLLSQPPTDVVWCFVVPDTQNNWANKTAWAKKICAKGQGIHHAAMNENQRKNWVRKRLEAQNISIEPAAIDELDYLCEGNLLALAQSLQMLTLMSDKSIGLNQIQSITQDQGNFNVFAFLDMVFNQKTVKALRVCRLLRGQKMEPVRIISLLIREQSLIRRLAWTLSKGESPQTLFKQVYAWPARQTQLLNIAQRHSKNVWAAMDRKLGFMDRQAKGLAPGDVWLSIERFIIQNGRK